MSMQKEAYCRDGRHEESKRHGKLRTKYNRLAWGIHVLNELCLVFCATNKCRTLICQAACFEFLLQPGNAGIILKCSCFAR